MYCSYLCIVTDLGCPKLFIGVSDYDGSIGEVRCSCDIVPVREISYMICVALCVKKVGLLLSFVDLFAN